MNIGFTYDLETEYLLKTNEPPDALAEFDRFPTIDLISKSLEKYGNKVTHIGNVYRLLTNLEKIKKSVDIVFNIAEGRFGRNREAQIPVILELKGIPYVGSDGLTQALTLDKFMTKKILMATDLPTPKYFQIVKKGESVTNISIKFPLIVKPRWEGSSKGISKNSRVENEQQLTKQVNHILDIYHQPALIEEFIKGDEYTVAIIGNAKSKVAYIYKVVIGSNKPSGDDFYLGEYIENNEVTYVPAKNINLNLKQVLQNLAYKTYETVGCVDFGRVDFRVDRKGQPYILEINPLPSLNKSDTFGCLANDLGIEYAEMIQRVFQSALKRLQLKNQFYSYQPRSKSHFSQLFIENSA